MDKSNGASPYNQNKGLYDETPGPAIYDPAMFEPVFTDSTPNTLQPVEMPFTNFEPMRGDHRQVGASYPFPPFILDIPQYLVPNVPEPSRVNIIGGFVPPLQTYNHPRPPEPAVLPAYHANMIQHTPLIGSASTSSFNMPFELHNPDPQLRATPLSAHSIHLLETNFRDPSKLELRNFLHLVLTSPWFHADELEPQNDSQHTAVYSITVTRYLTGKIALSGTSVVTILGICLSPVREDVWLEIVQNDFAPCSISRPIVTVAKSSALPASGMLAKLEETRNYVP
ncbi:hypothetical protein PIIN_09417 [Serendipita indica DSM 11827]|uniref:Uncharacterized protein n=1 Tax=Serendipita indica (strain DSM 11827) TaxID=1109443 RepID=G4TVU1_SERID|nr:hypothetical protein PIIN_09417 [Serendipita indica DSM 11827]